MRDGRDTVHIPGLESPSAASELRRAAGSAGEGGGGARPWIGILFRCCGVYARIYRDPASPAYRGVCPRCSAEVSARVGPGGTAQRIFYAE